MNQKISIVGPVQLFESVDSFYEHSTLKSKQVYIKQTYLDIHTVYLHVELKFD